MTEKLTKYDFEHAKDITKLALEQPINQESELTGVMKTLNEDSIETGTRLPSIDMRTRLHPFEVSSILVHDTIVALDCLPNECLITTRVKKRLAVSLLGKGREEMVRIVQGERENKTGEGVFGKMKNLFMPQQ